MKIKNWHDHQPYRDGRPTIWIKLYKALLNDYEWAMLDGDAAKMLINLWLLAAENDGELPDIEVIAFRLRTDLETVKKNLVRLSHWVCTDSYETVQTQEVVCTDSLPRVREEVDKELEEEIEGEGEGEGGPAADASEVVTEKCMQVFEDWNAIASKAGLPAMVAAVSARRASLRQRWKEKWWRENYHAALTRMASSAFCTGTNDRQWKADIDWFLKSGTVARLLEGKYDDRQAPVARNEFWRESDADIFGGTE